MSMIHVAINEYFILLQQAKNMPYKAQVSRVLAMPCHNAHFSVSQEERERDFVFVVQSLNLVSK